MIPVRIIIYFMVFLSSSGVFAQPDLERKFNFPGYDKSDSLHYSAETIDYLPDDSIFVLKNNAKIVSLGRMLRSNSITYYQNYDYMEALGRRDSTGTLTDTPVFRDTGGEELNGEKIIYNTDSRKGVIVNAKTQYENGFMYADIIKRGSDDTLYVADGTYTTCDLEHPHYYFSGRQMKFILNDKLIIKPVVAYLADIPVMWFPFYVFPIAKGRQSGFLTPRYGSSRIDGRYFSNLGYYFAPSNIFDYKAAATLREKNGWLVNNWINYNQRYKMSGSVYGSYEVASREGSRQWKLSGSHRQTISNTLSLTGNVNMQSSEYSRNNSPNLYQRMNRNMNSSLRISKKWEESGNSLITYLSHTKNLDSESRTTVAPSFSFTMPKRLVFGQDQPKRRQRKYTQKSTDIADDEDKKWYETIYYSSNASLKNTERDNYSLNSMTNEYSNHTYEGKRDMSFNASLTSSNKFMGWLNANPSLSLDEQFLATTDSLSHKRNDNLSMGLSLSTKIYGTFNPSVGSLKSLRHVISPSITYRYGKRREYEGTSMDVLYRFDKNNNKNGKISSMNISFRNLFQAKTLKEETENKIDLFTLDFSTSVDFEREERIVSPLRTTLDIKPLQTIKVRLTSSHEFYHDDDKFYLFSPYLSNMGVTTTVGLTDRNIGQLGMSSRVNANRYLGRDDFMEDIDMIEDDVPAESGSFRIPFNVRFTHYYKVSRGRRNTTGGYSYREIHTIKPNISFSPSKNMSIRYNLYYDFKSKELSSHQVLLRRDLHCWEMNISWVPSGIREGFFFKVNIKDLPDVKIEKRRGVSRFSG